MNERDIFLGAIQLTDPAEHSAYLEKMCAGNASLKRHMEAMLHLYPQLGTFLESPAVDLDSETTPLKAGRFQLGEELARGGMGVVYRARDDSLGRDVAVKVLHERYLVDSFAGQRFLDEARITAQLQHPGIPPVFEVGRLPDERPYLAMKLIKGRTLQELLQERSEPASDRGRFLAVFEQICQAVGYAHSKHILHRDLKPANVMVGAFGEAQVMDWGLAKVLEADGTAHEPAASTETPCGTVIQTAREPDSATLAGCMLGTPAFAAPEQAGGELGRLDERTDVFGLGAILCVILTGEPPYAGQSVDEVRLMAIRGTLAEAHARLEQCGADAKLVELCRQCLSPQREARPRDGGAVAATIAGYLAGVEERARQAELERGAAEARAAEQRKRRRVQLGLAAALLILFGVVGFGLWWQERVEAIAAAERAARESGVTAGVAEALREARARSLEAWKLVDYPERMQRATDVAVAALRRGEDFARGEAPDEITLEELTSTRREVDELARHTALINAWDANTQKGAEDATGDSWREAEDRFTARCHEAFREFGLDPVHAPADEVAKAVAFSPLRDVLLGMLLDWHWHSYGEDRPCLWRVIRSARQLSGGAYARWQELLDAKDVPGLVAFAASPEGLSFRSILTGAVMRDLRDAKQYAACYTFLRAATERYPHYAWLHYDLADICRERNPPEYAEALRHSSAATVQRPDSAVCHLQLGKCYADLGSYDQAVAAFRKSIQLGRGAIAGYLYMSDALAKKKDWDGALAAAREAIRLQPNNSASHSRLGVTLSEAGRHAEALRTTLAFMREHPDLVEKPGNHARYNAACFAMNCADGLGSEAPPQTERPAYRKQALDFLTAQLTAERKLATVDSARVHEDMQYWLSDKDLASVREPLPLGLLQPAEREPWNRLWVGVHALLDQTAIRMDEATKPTN